MLRRVALLTSILLFASATRPSLADACGIKLTAKTPTPRRTARATPGSVLLLGKPDRNLEKQLVAAGHTVDTAPDVASAKRASYNVILADTKTADEAREAFGDGAVIVRSGDTSSDARQVVARANRRPVRATDRTVVAARLRQPVAAGPKTTQEAKTVVAARVPEPTPTPTSAPVPPAPIPTPTPAPTPNPATAPARVAAVDKGPASETTKPAARSFTEIEVHFGTNQAGITAAMKRQLDLAARWLAANADARVVIEGHADPKGTPDSNMELSRQRAEAVREYLTSAGGDSSRLDVEALGDTKLKYGAGDGRNRRVFVKKQ